MAKVNYFRGLSRVVIGAILAVNAGIIAIGVRNIWQWHDAQLMVPPGLPGDTPTPGDVALITPLPDDHAFTILAIAIGALLTLVLVWRAVVWVVQGFKEE